MWHDRVIIGDALTTLRSLPSHIADVCVTSPPYWSLRDYGVEGQYGLEATPATYVDRLVLVFREVKRVLKPGSTLWLVLGDTYYSGAGPCNNPGGRAEERHPRGAPPNRVPRLPGLKPKDLVGIPWRVALALQADGWWLRNDIIWHKTNGLPSPITDRLSCRHEHVFLFANAPVYRFHLDMIREPYLQGSLVRLAYAQRSARRGQQTHQQRVDPGRLGTALPPQVAARPWLNQKGKNPSDVWSIGTNSSRSGHHATFPRALVSRAIKAGSVEGQVVLDPFCGTGTTLMVAKELRRHYLGIELNPTFLTKATATEDLRPAHERDTRHA